MSTIVIFGVTGYAGRHIAQELLDRGHTVLGVARHSTAPDALATADTTVDWFFLSPPANFGSHNPGTKTSTFRLGTDVLIVDADGHSEISGADFAIAVTDEIEKPAHHRARFTLGY